MFILDDNRIVIFLILFLGAIFTAFKSFIKNSDTIKNFVGRNRKTFFCFLILLAGVFFIHFYIKRELHNEYRMNSWWFCKKIDCRKKSNDPPQKLKYGISEVLKENE